MRSYRTAKFRKLYQALPTEVKALAVKSYAQWWDSMRTGTHYPGLNWELIDPEERTYTVRVGLSYRAMCIEEDGAYTWFWIGSKGDWERAFG